MKPEVGIWIDHSRAVVVNLASGHPSIETIESGVPGHPRFGGQQDGGGEKKYEARHKQNLTRFYDEVLARLPTPASLFILGPGEARTELRARVPEADGPVALEAADSLTEPALVARVKAHFAHVH